jgi:hypothetical protein
MSGLDDNGFTIESIEDMLQRISAKQRASIDPLLDNSADGPLGVLNAIIADKARELWEGALAAYLSMDPNNATGVSLARVAAITGTMVRTATRSQVIATVTLEPGVNVVPGDIASVVGNPSIQYEVPPGTGVSNPTSGNVDLDIVMVATEPGSKFRANSGTLSVIATPKVGWLAVTNNLDSTIGLDPETDTELRVRRIEELSSQGSASLDAIRSNVAKVAGTNTVLAEENTSIAWDNVKQLPPKSFEIVVGGGDDAAIARAIYDTRSAGIESYGNTQGDFVLGVDFLSERFSRPNSVLVLVEVDCEISPDGNLDTDALKAAIVIAGSHYVQGQDVYMAAIVCAAMDSGETRNVAGVRLGIVGGAIPSLQDLSISSRSVASFDSSRISINWRLN